MLDIFEPLFAIFFTVSTMVLAFVLFGILLAEHGRSKLPHLFFMALAQLCTGLAFLSFFTGQILYLNDQIAVGGVFIDQAQGMFLVLAAAAVLVSLLTCLTSGRWRAIGAGSAAIMTGISLVSIFSAPSIVLTVNDVPFSGTTVSAFFIDLLPLLVEHLALIGIGCGYVLLRMQGRIDVRPHLWFFGVTGVLGAVFMGTYLAAVLGVISSTLFAVAYLLVPFILIGLFSGAIAHQHRDPEVVRRPWKIFASSVMIKIGAVNIVVFLVGSFVLIGITAVSFNRVVVASRQAGVVTFVEHAAFVQDASERSMLRVARGIVARVAADRLYEDQDEARFATFRQVIAVSVVEDGLITFVTMVDGQGRVIDLFDTSAHADLADLLAASPVRQGETVISVLQSSPYAGAEVVVQLPVMDNGNVEALLVVGSRIDTAQIGMQAAHLPSSALPISYGLLTQDGISIFSSGNDVLPRDIVQVSATDGHAAISRVNIADRTEDVATHVIERSGIVVYGFSPHATARRSLLAVIFTVVLFALSIATALAAFEIFSIRTILSPLRKLSVASRRMAFGDYRARSGHRSSDEIGNLAASFDAMVETIQERTTRLEDLLREQKDFMLHTVHELRNPLNHFRWTLELLRFGEAGKLTSEQLTLVEQMNITNRRLEHMVQNIIDTEKLSEGKLVPDMQDLEPIAVIDDVVGEMSLQARAKGVEFQWQHPKGGVPIIRADKEQFARILRNLVGNAVKYTDKGGSVTLVASAVRDESGREACRVTVTDTGRGIPTKDQSKLFMRFYRASNVLKKDIEGTGLGLYIVRKIVELHDGSIRFESEEGKGTTFVVTIPASTRQKS